MWCGAALFPEEDFLFFVLLCMKAARVLSLSLPPPLCSSLSHLSPLRLVPTTCLFHKPQVITRHYSKVQTKKVIKQRPATKQTTSTTTATQSKKEKEQDEEEEGQEQEYGKTLLEQERDAMQQQTLSKTLEDCMYHDHKRTRKRVITILLNTHYMLQ